MPNKWSPGPWKQNSCGIESADSRQVCETFGEEQDQNLELIAAAPDLYAALEPFYEIDAKYPPLQGPDDKTVKFEFTLGQVRRMLNALAKARGESPK